MKQAKELLFNYIGYTNLYLEKSLMKVIKYLKPCLDMTTKLLVNRCVRLDLNLSCDIFEAAQILHC